jgi:geranylgeranyl pyrophosphate synthase
VRAAVDGGLQRALGDLAETEVRRAAGYVVLNGGHRWRALTTLAAGQIFQADPWPWALAAACGVELAHAASLVLDDLPSMDNAELRRGKPCVHLVFPRWVVDLLPSYLIALAYQICLSDEHVDPARRVAAAREVSAAGLQMVEGQEMDLQPPPGAVSSGDQVLVCYRLKSGMLYAAAARAGAIVCGAAPEDVQTLGSVGVGLGVAYQLLDDVADVVCGVEELGKEPGMDVQKITAVEQFGVAGAQRRARQIQEEALTRLEVFGSRAGLLRELVRQAEPACRC